uniref:Peroxisomal membrane protein MPV17 n=1 Tax=Fibrocapsa japonica TaxID=94617 RepID=A0A7S2XWX9_9STRA|mmetsp:Transcript_1821/g.2544  ORF Transcript_1821/g.2544 Transcript_1821/m.2544 type:complete len:298 (+) Transcript_1821:67-960(+)
MAVITRLIVVAALCVSLGSAFVTRTPSFGATSVRKINDESMSMLFGGFGKGSNNWGGFGVKRGISTRNPIKGGNFGGNNGGIGGNGGNGLVPPRNSEASASSEGGDNNSGSNPFASLWAAYNAALESSPITTKALTSLVGFSLGDILAQKFLSAGEPFDFLRMARLASFGLLFHGPVGHYFYGFLDTKIPGTALSVVASKVAIDQIIWNPIFGTFFLGYMGFAEGKNAGEVGQKIKNDLVKAVTGSWTVWPIAHAINFRFIPTSQRLLYINSIQVFYNCFLSFLASGGSSTAEVATE